MKKEELEKKIAEMLTAFGETFFENYIIVDSKNKKVTVKIIDKCETAFCDEKDEFNWIMGFGIAISKMLKDNEKFAKARKAFKKTFGGNWWSQNSIWATYEFFDNDAEEVLEFIDFVDKGIKDDLEKGKTTTKLYLG